MNKEREALIKNIARKYLSRYFVYQDGLDLRGADELITLVEQALSDTCDWIHSTDLDGEQSWSTSCGEEFVLIEFSPAENLYNYCPNCGGKINETETSPPQE